MIGQINETSRETNVLTKLHENWAKNVTSRELTCFHYIHIDKNAPPTGGHVYSPIWTIFELFPKYETNVLTKFHEDRTKYVTTRNTAPPPGRHVFSPIWTIFELVRDINKINVLTNVHEVSLKTAPPTGGHVFQQNLLTNVYKQMRTDDGRTDDGQRPITKVHFSNQVS
ncbi:hypothetical protein DPMN_183307 [Dreissena polymorpha]|uniref:Uncharacterized protein n=1 Tax=Dreissena polymorpha TaxID=45954 RepID=A0A9D4DI57_DREPO|nr:hypothetical protein DPMN_183307 [Dreissena polymorpha]